MPPGLLVSEVGQRIAETPPFAVVIAAVAGDTLSQVRHLCLRLQKVNPDLPIIVGLWTPSSEAYDTLADGMLAAGADAIAGTFAETRAQLESLRQLLPA